MEREISRTADVGGSSFMFTDSVKCYRGTAGSLLKVKEAETFLGTESDSLVKHSFELGKGL